MLAEALLAMRRGQSADLAFVERGSVTVAECVAMAEGKTGALLGAACELGALAAVLEARPSDPAGAADLRLLTALITDREG